MPKSYCTRSEFCSRSPGATDRGVSMVEFALALPVFFLIVFGFFDVARYWQAKAALQQAAWEGMNEFSVNRDIKKLGSDDPNDSQAYFAAYDAIRAKIQQRAAQLAIAAGNNIENVDEVFPVMPPNSAELYKVPVEVPIFADFRGTFLPITVKIGSKTSGYIETFRTTSQPLVTDCFGYPYDTTDPPGQVYSLCPCNGTGVYDFSGQCVCSSTTGMGSRGTIEVTDGNGNTTCGCADGKIPISLRNDVAHYTAEQNQGYQNYFMMCCPPGTPETCTGGQIRVGQMMMQSPNFCNCTCPQGQTMGQDGNCGCDDPNKEYDPQTQSCKCKNPPPAGFCGGPTNGRGHWDEATCSCVCHYDHTPDASGACYCQVVNQTICNSMTPPKRFGGGQCKCFDCPSGTTLNTGDNTCHCNNENVACPTNMERDAATCNCKCDAAHPVSSNGICCATGLQNSNGVCCPPFATGANGNCSCPDGQHLSDDGKSCVCDLTCSNGYTAKHDALGNCICGCGAGRVPIQSSGGTTYCSPVGQGCRATCTFAADGTCSNCPPG